MAKFPEQTDIKAVVPFVEEIQFKTLVSEFDDLGEEQRKQKWLYPKRRVTLRYRLIAKSDAETLWEFYLARKGKYESFNFFFPHSDSYEGEYVGSGDGSTTVFNLPSKSGASYAVYIDSVAQSEGSDYTFGSGTGTDGADKVTFVSAPEEGERITYDFTGNLKIHCRFADDLQRFEMFVMWLTTMGITLQGLLNE